MALVGMKPVPHARANTWTRKTEQVEVLVHCIACLVLEEQRKPMPTGQAARLRCVHSKRNSNVQSRESGCVGLR